MFVVLCVGFVCVGFVCFVFGCLMYVVLCLFARCMVVTNFVCFTHFEVVFVLC